MGCTSSSPNSVAEAKVASSESKTASTTQAGSTAPSAPAKASSTPPASPRPRQDSKKKDAPEFKRVDSTKWTVQSLVDIVHETNDQIKRSTELEDMPKRSSTSTVASSQRSQSAPRSAKRPSSSTANPTPSTPTQTATTSVASSLQPSTVVDLADFGVSPLPDVEPVKKRDKTKADASRPADEEKVPEYLTDSVSVYSADLKGRGLRRKNSSSSRRSTSKQRLTPEEEFRNNMRKSEIYSQRSSSYRGEGAMVLDATEKYEIKQLGIQIMASDEKEGKKLLTNIERKTVKNVIHFHDTILEKEDYPPWVLREFELICFKYSAYLSKQLEQGNDAEAPKTE